jgi:hypothetical protein
MTGATMSAMTGTKQRMPRDDRAWPRGAAPISLAAGQLSLAGGVVITARQGWPLAQMALELAGLVAGLSLMIIFIVRWLRGAAPPPISIGLISSSLALAALDAGIQAVLGLVGGTLLGNVWAVRAARANRQSDG